MASAIQWFLVEIERRLSGDVSPDKVFELQQEANAHLTETSEEFRAQGMEHSEAERAAVARFGSPRSFRASALRQLEGRFLGLPMVIWTVAVGATALLINLLSATSFNTRGSFLTEGVLTTIACLMGLYAFCCFRIRRNPLFLCLLVSLLSIPVAWVCTGRTFVHVQNSLVERSKLDAITTRVTSSLQQREFDHKLILDGARWANEKTDPATWQTAEFRADSPRFQGLSPERVEESGARGLLHPSSTWLVPAEFVTARSDDVDGIFLLRCPYLRLRAESDPNKAADRWSSFIHDHGNELKRMASENVYLTEQLAALNRARANGFDPNALNMGAVTALFLGFGFVLAAFGQFGVIVRWSVSKMKSRTGFA